MSVNNDRPTTEATSPARAQPATADPIVLAATAYSHMKATPEQIDQMMLDAYGPDRQPGTASRVWSQEGHEPDPREVLAEMSEALRRAESEPPPPPECGPCKAHRLHLLTRSEWIGVGCVHSVGEIE